MESLKYIEKALKDINARISGIEDLLEATAVEPEPEEEPKLGYRYKRKWMGLGVVGYELVPDPNAKGTAKNPIEWYAGLECKLGYHYRMDGVTYMCVEAGAYDELTPAHFEALA